MTDEIIADEHVEDETTIVPEIEETEEELDKLFESEGDESLDAAKTDKDKKDEKVSEEQTEEEIAAKEKEETEKAKKAKKEKEDAEAEAEKVKKEEETKESQTKQEEKPKEQTSDAAKKNAENTKTAFIEKIAKDLGDKVIGDGGTEDVPMPDTMKEFAEQFPEIANTINTVAAHVYEEIMSKIDPLNMAVQQRGREDAEKTLFTELADDKFGHPDAPDIVSSDEFGKWRDEQSSAYQGYIDSADTAEDISAILDNYKGQTGIETKSPEEKIKAQEIAKQQRKDKAEKDKLHMATSRTKKEISKPSDGMPTEKELDDIFDKVE